MPESYPDFFRRITDQEILPYQERYGKNPFSPTLLIIPTGLGKTDAVLAPWLYARHSANPAAPTRLIIVLPRQNLTMQTAANARARRDRAGLRDRIRVLELMAGSDENHETLQPNEPAIIVCTQDLYFSRALNRGYARRAPRWPIDFALYNQDCLIVLDEIQLMDDALATSTQLAAFRKEFGIVGNAPCVWMSATVNPDWLRTVDFSEIPTPMRLEADDLAQLVVAQRIHAPKRLAQAPEECRTPAGCAAFALGRHQDGTRTLIIANTVPRAREIFSFIRKEFPDAILLHSRFRPDDRKGAAARLGSMVVSTQVLEAGMDITSRLLVTDIAPWGSLVQRFGRVNRRGEDVDPEIWWVDQPTYTKQKDPTAPYTLAEIERATERVMQLTSASAAVLPEEDGPEPWQYVLRRADLLDLFDTTPDLGGNNLDVSRFIRATEDKSAYLAWRDWEGEGEPPPDLPELADDELCPVPIGELREFAKKHRVYVWNFATEEWALLDRDKLYAGMSAVTRSTEGGYTATEGWSPDSKEKVKPLLPGKENVEGDSSDSRSFPRYRQTLRDHTDRVVEKLEILLATQNLGDVEIEALRTAAAKHDWGKAHPVFQATLHKYDDSPDPLAKQLRERSARGHCRKHFRHELASAVAMLAAGDSDLAVYLTGAHHGRIRLGIRSMPGETEKKGERVARGIHDGESLPLCELSTGNFMPAIELSLGAMEFGSEEGSWTDRMLRLRDKYGPFRLAYLEMLLRSADEAASADPGETATWAK